jgi:hypothetical protein
VPASYGALAAASGTSGVGALAAAAPLAVRTLLAPGGPALGAAASTTRGCGGGALVIGRGVGDGRRRGEGEGFHEDDDGVDHTLKHPLRTLHELDFAHIVKLYEDQPNHLRLLRRRKVAPDGLVLMEPKPVIHLGHEIDLAGGELQPFLMTLALQGATDPLNIHKCLSLSRKIGLEHRVEAHHQNGVSHGALQSRLGPLQRVFVKLW